MTVRFKWPIALAILIAAAAVVYFWRISKPDVEQAGRYRTVKIDRGDIIKSISANGTLNPVVLVNVGTQVSGTIQKLYADYNQTVREDQVLAELDPSLFRAALQQSEGNVANARASLKLAQANERRARDLYAKDYIPRSDLDQAIQATESARAQLNTAEGQVHRDRTNLGYSVIRSPVSGVVISRNVDVGQTVAASFQTPTLFTIAQDLKRMQIDTTVAEADVGGVEVGQPVNFTVDAFPDRDFHGKVRQIRLNSQVQQNVVTYDVVIDVDNPEELLMPGMTAFVNIIVDERHGVLRLPLAATRFRPEGIDAKRPGKPGERTVYRLDQGQPAPVGVRIGIADPKNAELLSDALNAGDELIVEDLRQAKKEPQESRSNFRVRMF